MLGVPDAYELPPIPGLAYLKPDPTTMLRFKAAYVSGPPSGRVRVRRDEGGKLQGILPFTISEVLQLDVPVRRARARAGARSSPASRSRCSTSPWRAWSATAPRPTRCGCRRSTCPTRSTS